MPIMLDREQSIQQARTILEDAIKDGVPFAVLAVRPPLHDVVLSTGKENAPNPETAKLVIRQLGTLLLESSRLLAKFL